MHVALAIFRLAFTDYIEPLTHALHYTTLRKDFVLRTWNKHDEFLLLFTEASFRWLAGIHYHYIIEIMILIYIYI
jgi:hypothetical protein